MDYLKLLECSFELENLRSSSEGSHLSRFAYLSDNIFDFTTYDSEMSDLFGRKAVEVCAAISDKKTFDYISDVDNYRWFLLMCNTRFFDKKLEWGTSIRGAWWCPSNREHIEIKCSGFWMGDTEAVGTLQLDKKEWDKFIAAVVEFGNAELKKKP